MLLATRHTEFPARVLIFTDNISYNTIGSIRKLFSLV